VTKDLETEDKDDLRERVLRASVDLIETEGLAALSMREVARRAGVSHQAPYHHFHDREAILAAVAERGFELLNLALTKARAEAQGPTHAVELSGIAYVKFACEHSAYFRIMFRPELVKVSNHAEVDCTADKAFGHVPELVAGCMKAGLPSDLGTETMVALLWSFVHGFACLLIDGPLSEKVPSMAQDQDKVIRDMARAMRRMIDATIAQGRSSET
jgi:AcrR family transcriptional regulator